MLKKIFQRNGIHRGLIVVLLGFLFLASAGLFYNFGLATTVNDETPSFVAALKMVGNLTLRPAYQTFYYMPLPAYAMLPFALLSVAALPVFGIATTASAIREFVILDFAYLLPAARLASVLYALATLALFYFIGLRIFRDRRRALIGAYLLGTSLLFFQLAHFGKVWSLQLFLLTYAFWSAIALCDETIPEKRRYIHAALAIAASFGVNVIAAVVYVAFFVAHFLRMKGRSFIEKIFHRPFLMTHILILLLILLLFWLNPYGILNYARHISSALGISLPGDFINAGIAGAYCGKGAFMQYTYYLRTLFGYEPLLFLLAIVGIAGFWRTYRREASIFGAFFVVYFATITALSILGANNCEPRYAAPIVLPLALFASFGVSRFLAGLSWTTQKVALSLFALVMLMVPVLYDVKLLLPSTRLSAREWVVANVPDGAKIITIDEKLDLPEDLATVKNIGERAPAHATVKRSYLATYPGRIVAPAYFVYNPSFGSYGAGQDFEYLIISWWDPDDRVRQLEHITGLGLFDDLERLRRFPGDARDRTISIDLPNNMENPVWRLWSQKQNGPVVDIYRLR